MLRLSIWKFSLSQENSCSVQILGSISNVSCIWSRASSGGMLNSRHSGAVERARPTSRRPWLMWSRNAARSATRTGWLKLNGARTAAWPTRRFFVWLAIAVSMISGAELWLKIPAAWCSTSHQQL